jgi:uncharacterized membrane protein YdbT with pleckstrin-like domain
MHAGLFYMLFTQNKVPKWGVVYVAECGNRDTYSDLPSLGIDNNRRFIDFCERCCRLCRGKETEQEEEDNEEEEENEEEDENTSPVELEDDWWAQDGTAVIQEAAGNRLRSSPMFVLQHACFVFSIGCSDIAYLPSELSYLCIVIVVIVVIVFIVVIIAIILNISGH